MEELSHLSRGVGTLPTDTTGSGILMVLGARLRTNGAWSVMCSCEDEHHDVVGSELL